jgi:molecular chaperone GrpE (heat shock protein)
MLNDSSKENNTVAEVMQTGWKIGDRVLGAAKVGTVKK